MLDDNIYDNNRDIREFCNIIFQIRQTLKPV